MNERTYQDFVQRLEKEYILIKKDRPRDRGPEKKTDLPIIDRSVRVEWLNELLDFVSETLGVSVEKMRSRDRKQEYSYARQIFFYIAKNAGLNVRLSVIGAMLHRDHSTVLHGAGKIKDICEVSQVERRKLEKIIENYTEYESRKQSERGLEKLVVGA